MEGPFGNTLHVTVQRADGTEPPHVWPMFFPNKRSNFSWNGLSFCWLNATLTVCGIGFVKLDAYGQKAKIRNASGALFRVAVFSTEARANLFLVTPEKTEATAS